MYDSIPEIIRKESVHSLFSTPTFNNSWITWKNEILRIIGQNYSENDILNLGDHLAAIFRTTGNAGRQQAQLSGGGDAWEALICWYINLCCIGSRVVALKKMSLVPQPIRDAITVNYGNFACNTESDITIIIFPDLPTYTVPANTLNIQNHNGVPIPIFLRNKFNAGLLHHLVSQDFTRYEIGIIQCKTNWNDNAQIPMLWDMIYSAGGFRGRNITIGRNGFSMQALQNFTYSFVTVPSNLNTRYQPTSVAVRRVTNLSGGNYWGGPTRQNVARSIKEIFTNNYMSGLQNNFRSSIGGAIPFLQVQQPLDYFNIH